MNISADLNLSAPITARLEPVNGAPITLLVNTSAIQGDPLLVTAKEWDGTSVDQARLEGTLGTNDKGCVTVGDTVVKWPNTYFLGMDRAGTWVIVTGDEDSGRPATGQSLPKKANP